MQKELYFIFIVFSFDQKQSLFKQKWSSNVNILLIGVKMQSICSNMQWKRSCSCEWIPRFHQTSNQLIGSVHRQCRLFLASISLKCWCCKSSFHNWLWLCWHAQGGTSTGKQTLRRPKTSEAVSEAGRWLHFGAIQLHPCTAGGFSLALTALQKTLTVIIVYKNA